MKRDVDVNAGRAKIQRAAVTWPGLESSQPDLITGSPWLAKTVGFIWEGGKTEYTDI